LHIDRGASRGPKEYCLETAEELENIPKCKRVELFYVDSEHINDLILPPSPKKVDNRNIYIYIYMYIYINIYISIHISIYRHIYIQTITYI